MWDWQYFNNNYRYSFYTESELFILPNKYTTMCMYVYNLR